jgi:hypothetical protein
MVRQVGCNLRSDGIGSGRERSFIAQAILVDLEGLRMTEEWLIYWEESLH